MTVAPAGRLPAPPGCTRHAAQARARHGALGQAWLDGLWQGDPLADAVVAEVDRVGHGAMMRMVSVALADGIDAVEGAPASLRELFAVLDDEPEWVDHAQLDRAGDHLARHATPYGIVLAAASLMVGYTNPAAARPLVLTGRLVEHAGVRNLEVGDWLREVMARGGLRRHGRGFERTVRVRLIHALVRRHLLRGGEWDTAELGTPISQPYMAHTLAEFGVIALDGMAVLGARHTPEERADIDALWRYVGHLSGVAPSLLPATSAAQGRIRELYQLTRPPVDDDSRALVDSLVTDYLVPEVAALLPLQPPGTTTVARAYVNGLIRAVVGHDLADELGIGRSPLVAPIRVAGEVTAAVQAGFRRVPGVRGWQTRRGRATQARQEARLRARYGMAHELVDTAEAPDHPAAPSG